MEKGYGTIFTSVGNIVEAIYGILSEKAMP